MKGKGKKSGAAGIIRFAITLLVIAVQLLCFVWLYPMLQSLAVMSVYSAIHYNESIIKQSGIKVIIPPGEGWYPLMLIYNADGFARGSGIDAQMSVLYSFGAFDMRTRTSALYDTNSNKYSAFYGAYVVQKDGGIFGFDDEGTLNMNEVEAAVRYDYTQLVMANFGCENPVFDVESIDAISDTECAGTDGWVRINATIRANGAAHRFEQNKTAHLQYGRPMSLPDIDFAEIVLAGRVYARYFNEYDCTVMLYCIAPDWAVVDECDERMLQTTTIGSL